MRNRGGVRFLICLGFAWIIGAGLPSVGYADPGISTSFTIQQLGDFLNSYQYSSDPRKQLLWRDLQQKLSAAGITFTPSTGITKTVPFQGNAAAMSCGDIQHVVGAELKANLAIHAVNDIVTMGTLVMGMPPAPPVLPDVPVTPFGPTSASWNGAGSATLAPQSSFAFGYQNGWLNFNANISTSASVTVFGDIDWWWGALFPDGVRWVTPPGQICDWFGNCIPPDFPVPTFKWSCNELGHTPFSVDVGGSFNGYLNTSLDISLVPNNGTVGPYTNTSGLWQIVIGATPQMAAGANIAPGSEYFSVGTTYVNVGPLWRTMESLFQGKVEHEINKFLNGYINDSLQQYTQKVPLAVYTLPANFDPAVFNLLVEAVDAPFLWDYIQAHSQQIMFYMLIGDTQSLAQMFASDAACASVQAFRDSSGILPVRVFTNAGGSCIAANAEGGNTGSYFADAACTVPLDFKPTPFRAWCNEVLGPDTHTLLGNSAAWTPDASPAVVTSTGQPIPATKWSIAQSTQLPIGVEALTSDTTPFMKRVAYRDVTWQPYLNDGTKSATPVTCHLEMRIYKKDATASNLTPLLAIHGGAWAYRGFGFNGLEADISHYTDQGFIVFAPFYRLAGNADGPAECHGAIWSDLEADADAALTWVQQNGVLFGAKGDPVTKTIKKVPLVGQSAGAHLSGYLVTHRPADVDRAFIEYPPTDVGDFITGVNNGTYAPAAGTTYPTNVKGTDYTPMVGTLATLMVPPLTAADTALWGSMTNELLSMSLTGPAIVQNGFPALVANAAASVPPVPMPPVFMLHGMMDTVVPPNQSVLLCNAYGGNAVDFGGGTALRATYNCGSQGYLHLFEEAQHAMDVCLTTRTNGLCLAGSATSAQLLADSKRTARNWLQNNQTAAVLAAIISLILY